MPYVSGFRIKCGMTEEKMVDRGVNSNSPLGAIFMSYSTRGNALVFFCLGIKRSFLKKECHLNN